MSIILQSHILDIKHFSNAPPNRFGLFQASWELLMMKLQSLSELMSVIIADYSEIETETLY